MEVLLLHAPLAIDLFLRFGPEVQTLLRCSVSLLPPLYRTNSQKFIFRPGIELRVLVIGMWDVVVGPWQPVHAPSIPIPSPVMAWHYLGYYRVPSSLALFGS